MLLLWMIYKVQKQQTLLVLVIPIGANKVLHLPMAMVTSDCKHPFTQQIQTIHTTVKTVQFVIKFAAFSIQQKTQVLIVKKLQVD